MKHTYQKKKNTKTQKWKIKINEQKNDKIKNVQTKQNDLKSLWKHHWYFVLAIYSWEGDLPWAMINNMQWDSIGENGFFICLQVSVAGSFWIRDGSPCLLPPVLAGTPSRLNLYRPYVYRQYLWVHMCRGRVVSGRPCFSGVDHLWFFMSFRPLYTRISEP